MSKYRDAALEIEQVLKCFDGLGEKEELRALEGVKWAMYQARIAAGVAMAVEVTTHPVHTVMSKGQAVELMSEMADALTMALPVFKGLDGDGVDSDDVRMSVQAIVNVARGLEAEYL